MDTTKRALLSVSDKTDLVSLAQGLVSLGFELISTGGTAKALRDAGLKVTDVSKVTGFPEMLDGRVKTLHPHVHGAILARRDDPEHVRQLAQMGIGPISLVVVNLYPFRETIRKEGVTEAEAIEMIDIGGPTLVRAAAKNYSHVTVVVDPADYQAVLEDLRAGEGQTRLELRRQLAEKAFAHTAEYDTVIAAYLAREAGNGQQATGNGTGRFPDALVLSLSKCQDLRYGENPHQAAAFYIFGDQDPEFRIPNSEFPGLAAAEQIQGKELSYNNLVDLDAALGLILEFERPAAAVLKHTNPCGCAEADTIAQAYVRAREADPVSAFGGIVALNRQIDEPTAKEITSTFIEAVIAPGCTPQARQVLAEKKNLRVLVLPGDGGRWTMDDGRWTKIRGIGGGLLVQDADGVLLRDDQLNYATSRRPTDDEWADLVFAFKVVKHVKSNAIVVAGDRATLGIGAGQMNRVGSVKIALEQAGEKSRGAVLASDAFFPFRDSVDLAAAAGISAIIQPGGSVRDDEVIAAAEEHGMAMVLTGIRHFLH